MALPTNFTDTEGYQQSYYGFSDRLGQDRGSVDPQIVDFLGKLGQDFNTNFKAMVGRDPTPQEASQFFNEQVRPNVGDLVHDNHPMRLRFGDYVADYVSKAFKGTVEQEVQNKLQAQVSQAQDLANQFRTQGRQAISDTESRLMDYQSRLFERLRPNLITSLQAQGLLNTGGLNEAVAGAQKDLASEASNYLTDANLQNELRANDIAFAGASAPYQFQQMQALNQLPYMQAQGEGALSRAFQTAQQQQQFNNQMSLLNRQAQIQHDAQPGLLGRLGQSFVTSFGNSMGNNLASWASPSGASTSQQMSSGGAGSAGNSAALLALLSSRSFKHDIEPVADEAKKALVSEVMNAPLYTWKYKGDTAQHFGVVTEEAPSTIVSPDGKTLSVIDYFGALTAAVQELHKEIEALKKQKVA